MLHLILCMKFLEPFTEQCFCPKPRSNSLLTMSAFSFFISTDRGHVSYPWKIKTDACEAELCGSINTVFLGLYWFSILFPFTQEIVALSFKWISATQTLGCSQILFLKCLFYPRGLIDRHWHIDRGRVQKINDLNTQFCKKNSFEKSFKVREKK